MVCGFFEVRVEMEYLVYGGFFRIKYDSSLIINGESAEKTS